jgi:uncharacterized protein
MERVLISGASGLVGAALVGWLQETGAEVVRLVRGPARNSEQVSWDPMGELSPGAVSGFEAVIHLAGESIAGRWTAQKKKAIRESRVHGTRTVAAALARAESKPRVFLCASAIGFYGNRGDEILTEQSPGGNGFLVDVSRDWEAMSGMAVEAGIRTVNLRLGLVLSGRGGALAKMLPVFKLGVGGKLGSGKQWWSWIHIDDMVGAVRHIIQTDTVSGPVNFVSPSPVRNEEFTKTLASVLGRPAFFSVPAFAMRLALRDATDELMLASQRVEPAALKASGYTFQYGDLRAALENLI